MRKKIVNLITVVGIVSTLTSASAAGWQNNTASPEESYYTIAAKLEQLCPKCFNFCWNDCLPQLPDTNLPETEAPEVDAPESDIPEAEQPEVQPPETQKPEVETPDIEQNRPVDSSYAQQVLELVNKYRAQYGLGALTLSDELSNVAQAKAQDMKNNNYFAHNSPTYGTPFDMMQSFGVTYRTAGENIAMGYSSPAAVVEGWMNSEGHRANILNGSFTQMGLGYVSSGNYWCQMFIG
ncbi:MAG: sporulation protein [Ruminococcaceae bacterium]|nr:sporulation protein [Oscillospiraceae bacterium]